MVSIETQAKTKKMVFYLNNSMMVLQGLIGTSVEDLSSSQTKARHIERLISICSFLKFNQIRSIKCIKHLNKFKKLLLSLDKTWKPTSNRNYKQKEQSLIVC